MFSMKNLKPYFISLLILIFSMSAFSQSRVAILDFENVSGISKYDGLGKAMSNMLITDLKNNIKQNKVVFLERSQLNKILEEQGLQKSKNFDNKTVVDFGKLAGVNYVILGSVYVLDGICNVSSRMVDVSTSEIVHSKEGNGKITNWLDIKTILANELSKELNNPIEVKSSSQITLNTLIDYSQVIESFDKGKTLEAQAKLRLLELTEIDSDYLIQLEKQVQRERIMNKYNEFNKKLNATNLQCSILGELVNLAHHVKGWGASHSGNYEFVTYFYSEKLDKEKASDFLTIINEARYSIGLPVYHNCMEYQDDVYKRVSLFSTAIDNLLSLNVSLDCESNIKEFGLGMMLAVIRDNYRVVSTNKAPKRHQEMFEQYKRYYMKLLELNPNSTQFGFISASFKNFKEEYEDYIHQIAELKH